MGILLGSCSVKKDTFTSRTYHKMNAHYNAYFNGNESLKEGVAQLSKSHQDNYLKILPVFKYGKEEDAQAVATNMDRAITKASIVIKRHSMVIKKTERNSWIGESYLLIGKANFYKQNYLSAKQTFEYIISHYKNEPVRWEASIWLARTYNQMKQFQKSQPQLDQVRNKTEKAGKGKNFVKKTGGFFYKREVPNDVYKTLPLVYADFYVQQENYNPAIEHLKKGIEMNHKRKLRARLNFIIAQIYQKSGDFSRATRYYRKVLLLNPVYEMAFNCKMNMAKCYNAKDANSRNIKKELLKMAKDIKNKDYLDQIYYALAEIALRENDAEEALRYLKLSAASGTNNSNQKALTFLKIANIYFEKPDYINAESYYDSTMTVLPNDFPEYTNIQDRKNTLSNLVKNLKTVKFEDSVQVFAKMTERERNAAIDKIINDYVKKEEEKKQAEINKQINQSFYGSNLNQLSNTGNTAAWYFYNPNSVKYGVNEFIRKWGNRTLEDNWFISNKKPVAFANNEESESQQDTVQSDSAKVKKETFNPRDRKSYLSDIPLTEEKLKASNQRIEEALYNLGFIYRDGFGEFKKSAGSFEELLRRFPETKFMLSGLYQLYKLYNEDLKNSSKAEYYKNLLISKFPDSDYAKMLQDPEYVQHIKGSKDAVSTLYTDTYQAYIAAQYSRVIENSNKALLSYKGNELIPKFELLRALSIGRSSDLKAFSTSLNDIVAKYPNGQEKQEAQNILDYISNKNKPQTKGDSLNTTGSNQQTTSPAQQMMFKNSDDAIHFYIMIVDVKDVVLNDIKNAISDFDREQFSLEKLNISSSFLGSEKQIITVSNFEDKEKGMRYYNAIKENKNVMASLKQAKCEQYIVSTDNYTMLFKTKDLKNYSKFFKENYLK